MRAKALVMVLGLAIAGTASAQQASAQASKPRKSKMICRADTTTGSRISRTSICATQEEWDAIDEAREANTRSMLRRMGTEAGNQPTVELMDPAQKAALMPGPAGGGGF